MLYVKDLKKGHIVYESSYGLTVELLITEDARKVNEAGKNGWIAPYTCGGVKGELFASDSDAHSSYAPRIYSEPMYGKKIQSKKREKSPKEKNKNNKK